MNRKIIKRVYGFWLIFFIASLASAEKRIPIRLDLHLGGGIAYAHGYLSEIFDYSFLIDIDGKALINKKDIKSRIPKKYRKFAGSEIYIGHILIPNTIGFSFSDTSDSWDFYIDWSIIGLNLFKIPRKNTLRAPANLRFNISLTGAFHLLQHDSHYYPCFRPGLQIRIDSHFRISKPVSLKLFVFQKGYIPDMERFDNEKRNIMPNYSGGGLGVIVHFFTRRKI